MCNRLTSKDGTLYARSESEAKKVIREARPARQKSPRQDRQAETAAQHTQNSPMTEELRLWKPQCAWTDGPDASPMRAPSDVALLMEDDDAEPADLHAFYRGAAKTVLHEQIFVPNDTYDGKPWYEEMPSIREIRLEWQDDKGAWHHRNGTRVEPCRPLTLRFTLSVECPNQNALGALRIPTDIAVANPMDPWPPNGLLVPKSTFINPEEMAEFLLDACHEPNDPSTETDSRARQAADFKAEMFEFACNMMLTREDAATLIMERLARTHLQAKARKLAPGQQIIVSLHPEQPAIVSVKKPD